MWKKPLKSRFPGEKSPQNNPHCSDGFRVASPFWNSQASHASATMGRSSRGKRFINGTSAVKVPAGGEGLGGYSKPVTNGIYDWYIYLSIDLFIYLSVCLPIYLSISLSLSIYLRIYLSIYLPTYLSVCQYVCLSVCLYGCVCVSMYVCIYVSAFSMRMSWVCMCMYL